MSLRIQARLADGLDLSQNDILARCGFQDHGPVQIAIDQSVIDYSRPYVPTSPARTLVDSAQIKTDVGSGLVVWDTPYAHYQYMGIVYGPNIPIYDPDTGILLEFRSPPVKHPTDRKLQYDKSQAPMAGPFWFERMKADHINDILNNARGAAMKEV